MTKQLSCLPLSLGQLAEFCHGKIVGDADIQIQGICSAEKPYVGGLAYIGSQSLIKQIDKENGTIYIVKPEQVNAIENGILHDNPTQAFRQILVKLYPSQPSIETHQRATAQISPQASIADDVAIGHHCVIEENVIIGKGCRIGNGCTIAAGSTLGENTQLGNRVSVLADCVIGSDCVIADGAVIGGQGLGLVLRVVLGKRFRRLVKLLLAIKCILAVTVVLIAEPLTTPLSETMSLLII